MPALETPPLNVLVLDDEESIRWVIRKAFAEGPYKLRFAETAEEATGIVKAQPIDFALVDIHLPGDDGLAFLAQQKALHPELLVAIITGEGTMHNTVTAMKLGAFDFITKPFDLDEIEALFRRAAQSVLAARTHGARPQAPGGGAGTDDTLVGKSRSVREIYKAIGRVAESELNVLILGESGTGKELIAQSIHQHSGRGKGPFAAVNCAAIPKDLLEAELFGYEKGAFTGAVERKPGRMEQAKGGTLFLDEIGDLPLDLQAKLLRVLQEREFQRVGGLETLRLDARVVAATNQALEQAVEAGRFRRDLFYRINTVTIPADPLRERREDIPPLVEHFLRRNAGRLGLPHRAIAPEALAALVRYDWPGNVRELENVIKSLAIMTRGAVIGLEDLPRALLGGGAQPAEDFEQTVARFWRATVHEYCAGAKTGLLHAAEAMLERPLIRQVLAQVGGNQVRAAQVLGINRNTLRAKMQALGIRKGSDG
jgi:two-component system nitrogen regulation response regulator GlnG